ncbi:MAG: hypothetical protein GY803_22970 [Chloroflexi bacterium]|nr:hypothetical protein [Chloroflexota bacterium]
MLTMLLAVTAVPSLRAQDDNGITMTVQAGFDGFYKPGFGVPVHVNVANSGTAVEGQLRIELGTTGNRNVYTSPISLPTQSEKRITLYVHIARHVSSIEIELRNDNDRIVTTAHTGTLSQLADDDLLYGVVSPEPGELEFLENVTGGRSNAAVAFLDLAKLPTAPAAWNGLDVLILNDVDTGQFTAAQMDALTSWIQTGGQLVVTGGPGWQKTAVALADLLPVTITGDESVADLPSLSQHAGEPFRDPGPYIVAAGSLRRGELLVHQDGLPLLAADRLGRGSVYYLALDPKLAPLLDWDGSERLWAEIALRVPDLPDWAMGVRDPYTAVTAVSSLPSLALPSVLNMTVFLFIYVIVIGPVNYMVLKRMKRRELAWATIPAIIIFFAALAYVTGFQLKGNDTIVNQMSIVYGQAGGDQARVQTLLGLYSPRRKSYDVTLPGDVLARPFERNFNDSGNVEAIRRGSDVTLEKVRVDVSGTETFVADHVQPILDVTGQATLNLDSGAVILEATLQNNSDITLETATIMLGSAVIKAGDLKPGEVATISERIYSSSAGATTFGPASGPSGYASPLMSHADLILGTSNYYNDKEAYPRWQLLQAIANASHVSGLAGSGVVQSNVVTLIAWSEQIQLDVSLGEDKFNAVATSLYFLEIPLAQNLASSGTVAVPATFLDWELIDDSGLYEAAIYDLYLEKNAWAAFEFTPWPEFQTMQPTGLSVILDSYDASQLTPQIRLWDWEQDSWGMISPVSWGEIRVGNDYGRFIGPNNAVRIRVQGSEQYGQNISEVYPVLTGNLE